MKLLLSCAFQLTFLFLLSAQASTIFEVFELNPEGCPLSASSAIPQKDSAIEDGSPQPRQLSRQADEGVNHQHEMFSRLGQQIKSLVEQQPTMQQAQLIYDEEYAFTKHDQGWALQKGEETLLPPQFDHVRTLPSEGGFIGYKGAQANFYNLAGEAHFASSYYDISPTKDGHFIIYGIEGAGLITAKGEILLTPTYERISLFSQKEVPYYHVQTSPQTSFLYAIETGERIHYNARSHEWTFLTERYASIGTRQLIDLQEKKVLFCEKEINIQVLDIERKWLSIALAEQPNKRYLVRFDGQMVSSDPYYSIPKYHPEGYLVVGLLSPYRPGERQKTLFGIIDTLGQWVLPAKYKQLTGPMIAGKYFQIVNSSGGFSLLNSAGDTLFPFQRSPRFALHEDGKSLDMYYKENGQAVGIRCKLRNGKLRPITETVYLSKSPFLNCGNEAYSVADIGNGKVLLDPNGQPVLEDVYRRIFTGEFDNTFITLEARPSGAPDFGPYRQMRNCDGSLISFQVDGQAVDKFHNLLVIEEGFYFLSNDLKSGNFLFPDGTSRYSEYGWRQVIQRLGDTYILGVAGNKYGLISSDGTVLIPPIFQMLYFRKNLGLIEAQLSDYSTQWIQSNGELLFEGQYEAVIDDKAGNFIVKRADRFGVVAPDGQLIIPLQHKRLHFRQGFYQTTDWNGIQRRFDRMGKRY